MGRENPIRISHVICHGRRYHQGARRKDMTATETFSTLRQFWLKHFDATEVFDHGPGYRVWCRLSTPVPIQGILPVVTDLETSWQNSVVERHGALFEMAFEKACSLEAPTTGAEVNELIDFTFAELNRRVGRQPTKSVSRRVRLAIERNIDEMCPKRNPQSRLQHENPDVRSDGTTRPLRGVAVFDETCDLTDEDAQKATVRACRSVNHGIIILGITRTASKSHLEFCMKLCTGQHERGAIYIMILTDSECALSEEQFSALETLHRSEGSAWLGRDLRQAGIGARLDANLPAMSRARVWTDSFTMAEYIQTRRAFPFAENCDTR